MEILPAKALLNNSETVGLLPVKDSSSIELFEDELQALNQDYFINTLNSELFYRSICKAPRISNFEKGEITLIESKKFFADRLYIKVTECDYYKHRVVQTFGADALYNYRNEREHLSQEEVGVLKNHPPSLTSIQFTDLTCNRLMFRDSLLLRGLKFTSDSCMKRVSFKTSCLQSLRLLDSGDWYEKSYISITDCEVKESLVVLLLGRTLTLRNVRGSKLIVIVGNSGIGLENSLVLEGKIEFEKGIEVINLKEALEREIIDEEELSEDLYGSTQNEYKLKNLLISNSKAKSSIQVSDIVVDTLSVSTSVIDERLQLTNVEIKNYSLSNTSLNIEHPCELRGVKIANKLNLISSKLYSKKFINCSLEKVQKFEIKDCDLSEVLSLNTTWKIRGVKYATSNANYFKFVNTQYKNEGNLGKLLESQVAILENTRKTTSNRFDKALLFLGYHSSRHGTCFKSSITSFVLINYIFFLLVNLIILTIGVSSHGITIDELGFLPSLQFRDAITILNPVHKFSDLSYQGGTWFYVFDWLSRIMNSYLIFQIVKSSRKYLSKI